MTTLRVIFYIIAVLEALALLLLIIHIGAVEYHEYKRRKKGRYKKNE